MSTNADTSTVDEPGIIRDQREMIGADRRHETVADVEAAWEEWVARHGLPHRRRHGDNSTDLRETRKTVRAYISGGKWIADCPNCNGGVAAWRGNPRGACLDCGSIYRVNFPTRAEEKQAVELLAARPDPLTRSWHRHTGETVDELAAENERYLTDEPGPSGVVEAGEIVRVLGRKAYERLRESGVA